MEVFASCSFLKFVKRRADSREPQQRCNLPLYRIPSISAYPAELPAILLHALEEHHTIDVRLLAGKKEPPRLRRPGRFGDRFRFSRPLEDDLPHELNVAGFSRADRLSTVEVSD